MSDQEIEQETKQEQIKPSKHPNKPTAHRILNKKQIREVAKRLKVKQGKIVVPAKKKVPRKMNNKLATWRQCCNDAGCRGVLKKTDPRYAGVRAKYEALLGL